MSQKNKNASKQDHSTTKKGDRIAKVMARAGLCSRREAERWIEAGRVTVNGEKLDSPACVVTDDDNITVDGRPLPGAARTRLFLYHKPAGLITTNKDEKGRRTIFDEFPKELPRVVTVGRLDMNTEGLLLLTTNGELARHLELPSTGWKRRYKVRIHGRLEQEHIDKLKNGMTVHGINYGEIEAKPAEDGKSKESANSWNIVSLHEGKKREIRIVFDALGFPVNRLIRLSYGPFQLGNLTPGSVKEIPEKVLKDQLPDFI